MHVWLDFPAAGSIVVAFSPAQVLDGCLSFD